MAEAGAWELRAGDEVVPGHRMLERLGGGKREEVFVTTARDCPRVVVKLLRPGRRRATDRRALAAEGDLLGRLDHPAFPRLLGRGEGERPHLVLEHLPGQRMSTALRRSGRLDPARVARIGAELADALRVLHRAGYVHLDVKPANILLADRAHLVDVGLARTIEAAAHLGARVGTRRYLAPEQCPPVHGVTPAADVWGLGLSLLQGLVGRYPFDDPDETYPQLTVGPLRPPAETPRQLTDVIAAALATAPEQRPTPGELLAWLEPSVAG